VRVDLFDFDLPEDRIALRPVVPRDAARLLAVEAGGALQDRTVAALPSLLRAGDVLVCNDTRVLPVQLFGTRGAARIGVTLHKRIDDRRWWAFARNARRLHAGDTIVFAPDLTATVAERTADGQVLLEFSCDGTLDAALAQTGVMPLPPYIASRRPADARDAIDYQTLFARADGSVAAPTAGLHFTDDLLAGLEARGVSRVAVTLHVGAGTFLPVKTATIAEHVMHAEWGEVSASAAARINAARAGGGRIVAVGTTALRLLESAADATGRLAPFAGETAIFITPGYRFRTADLLLTNFHLPRSTLFMLVCAFAGTARMQAAYAHAITSGYRFYSYGDACLLERPEQAS